MTRITGRSPISLAANAKGIDLREATTVGSAVIAPGPHGQLFMYSGGQFLRLYIDPRTRPRVTTRRQRHAP